MQKFTGEHLCESLFFNKVAGLWFATLFKKRLLHKCFSVNFAKLLRTLFLQNTSERLLRLEFHQTKLFVSHNFHYKFANRSVQQICVFGDTTKNVSYHKCQYSWYDLLEVQEIAHLKSKTSFLTKMKKFKDYVFHVLDYYIFYNIYAPA